jgi:diacylglycerol O-acyltransferase / wax synthase
MANRSTSYLSQNDAIMWHAEADPLLRSTIVVVMVLDRSPPWELVQSRVRRTIDEVPALRQRVVRVPLHPGVLQWVDVHDLDLGYHLRRVRLPEPAGLDQVLELARTTAAGGFDPARPLWGFTLVDGLDDGRSAFIVTAHHVVSDGIGAVRLAAHLFDLSPDAPHPESSAVDDAQPPDDATGEPAAGSVHAAPEPGALDRWLGAVVNDVETLGALAATQVHDAVPNLIRALRQPVETARETTTTVRSVVRTVAPSLETRSPLMTERSMHHRFEVLDLPFDRLRAAGRAAGATLNDAFLAGITGGMRRYHEHHGVSVSELRMAIPISLRTDDHGEGGNHVTVLRTDVPVGVADPRERISRLHEVGLRLRDERSLAHTEAIASVLNAMPRGVIGAMLKRVDFLASNVPGVPVPLYLAGSEVLEIYPFGPTAGSSVNLTLMSYRGRCGIGVHIDSAAIPDAAVFVRCIAEGFDEVDALVQAPAEPDRGWSSRR